MGVLGAAHLARSASRSLPPHPLPPERIPRCTRCLLTMAPKIPWMAAALSAQGQALPPIPPVFFSRAGITPIWCLFTERGLHSSACTCMRIPRVVAVTIVLLYIHTFLGQSVSIVADSCSPQRTLLCKHWVALGSSPGDHNPMHSHTHTILHSTYTHTFLHTNYIRGWPPRTNRIPFAKWAPDEWPPIRMTHLRSARTAGVGLRPLPCWTIHHFRSQGIA